MATQHDPQRISLIIRRLRPSFARHALTTSPSASRSRTVVSGSFPTTPTCPPSRCPCAAMPAGLDIDYERDLNRTMPLYAQHVVVRTGRDDWGRRIEDEDVGVEGTGMNFARSLKGLVRRGGKFFDPERPILITNSSLPESVVPGKTSVHVFPQNLRVPNIPDPPEAHEAFVSRFINTKSYLAQKSGARRAAQESEGGVDQTGLPIPKEDIVAHNVSMKYNIHTSPTILICGHDSRDTRCGILGPLLRTEFNSYIKRQNQQPADDECSTRLRSRGLEDVLAIRHSRVALTSHIGGHAFAGNVIIYLPKTFRMASGEVSPLAGLGIWYGRVEPRHVWGIMEETIQRGCVINELLRGIHKPGNFGGYS